MSNKIEILMKTIAEAGAIPIDEMDDNREIQPSEWDSIVILDVIAAIDEHLGVTIPLDSLQEVTTVGELRRLMKAADSSN